MPTKFSEVYDRAIFKFTDYSFIGAVSDFKEALLQRYLLATMADFQPTDIDLSYDIENEQFNSELSNEVIEILSWGIAYNWINAQAMNSELLRNIIHKKDYTSYSPANLLKEVQTLRDTMRTEFFGRANAYTFAHGDVSSWKV